MDYIHITYGLHGEYIFGHMQSVCNYIQNAYTMHMCNVVPAPYMVIFAESITDVLYVIRNCSGQPAMVSMV